MLFVYMNYPAQRISVHRNSGCTRVPMQHKPYQRVIHIDGSNVESELQKLKNNELKFAATRGLNDVWIYINLAESSSEENLIKTIHQVLGHFYKRIAHAKIEYHCLHQARAYMPKAKSVISSPNEFKHSVRVTKERIPDRESKIDAIVKTITTRIADFNSLYRSGPSLYFYRRILTQRRKFPNIKEFLSLGYNLEILYAVLVSWDMNSRGAKMKYFDDFKSNLMSCRPELEAIESRSRNFNFEQETEMFVLLKNAYLKLELMETAGRLVSNSKCLHFLFPTLFMPMDGSNTLQYLYNNSYESPNRYLDIIKFQFEVVQKPANFKKCLDDRWNQSIPKLIDNAIILLRGISVKSTGD